MRYIDRRILNIQQEAELKKMGFILSFKYSLDQNLNVFEIFVAEISR